MTKYSTIKIENYEDENGNKIICNGSIPCKGVIFHGKNNTLIINNKAQIVNIEIIFFHDNAICKILKTKRFLAKISLGENTRVYIGNNVSSTDKISIEAAEGRKITIGDDCMFAVDNSIRAHDSHAIYNVVTRKRINQSKDITIEDHVWLARKVVVLSGAHIQCGSIIGWGSLVKGFIPNNVIASGVPARIVKRHVAWERPHINRKTYAKQCNNRTSQYWNLTNERKSLSQNAILTVYTQFMRIFSQKDFELLSKNPILYVLQTKHPLNRLLQKLLNAVGPPMFR